MYREEFSAGTFDHTDTETVCTNVRTGILPLMLHRKK